MSWPASIIPLLNACSSALILLDRDLSIAHCNSAAQTIVGDLPVVGAPFSDALRDPGADPLTIHDGARFTASIGDEQYGFSVGEVAGKTDRWYLLTLTRIGPQQRLKRDLRRLERACAVGDLGARVDEHAQSGTGNRVARRVNTMLDHIRDQVEMLSHAINKMADCDLQIALETDRHGDLGTLQTRLSVTVSNLSESIRQTIASSAAIADTAAHIANQNKQLAGRTRAQSDAVQHTSSNMTELSTAVAHAAENATSADEQGQETTRLAEAGRTAVNKVVTAMDSIDQSASEVNDIIGIINDIAFQTNILALNAAVEAARAGEHGRGFSIVASEVRSLAGRSADAANQIKTLIQRSAAIASDGKQLAVEADQRMTEILSGVRNTSEQINAISAAAQQQTAGIQDAQQALSQIDDLTRQNHELVEELAQNTDNLDQQASYLNEAAQIFRLPEEALTHPLHREAHDAAVNIAVAVGQLFEQAIAQGMITAQALFDRSYTPIADTDPPKHHTPYDALTDKLLPDVQERLLRDHTEFVYCIAADSNGYVPTHNEKFSQALTGDYQTDLAGNRTKRVFNDRVGQQVGRHTQPWKLQTYRRDTGELMFDMSAPIYVGGEHWGGFRIGYRIA